MYNLISNRQNSELYEPAKAPVEESKNNFEQLWRESPSEQLNAVQEDDSMAVSMINLEEQRRFFCSELVMKALKECKILKYNQERSSNFLPADLTSEKQRFELVDGASYGTEQLILTDSMMAKNQE